MKKYISVSYLLDVNFDELSQYVQKKLAMYYIRHSRLVNQKDKDKVTKELTSFADNFSFFLENTRFWKKSLKLHKDPKLVDFLTDLIWNQPPFEKLSICISANLFFKSNQALWDTLHDINFDFALNTFDWHDEFSFGEDANHLIQNLHNQEADQWIFDTLIRHFDKKLTSSSKFDWNDEFIFKKDVNQLIKFLHTLETDKWTFDTLIRHFNKKLSSSSHQE